MKKDKYQKRKWTLRESFRSEDWMRFDKAHDVILEIIEKEYKRNRIGYSEYDDIKNALCDITISMVDMNQLLVDVSRESQGLDAIIEDIKQKLESLAIIFGIDDFHSYVNQPLSILKEEAIYMAKNNMIRLSLGLRKLLGKLPPIERKTVDEILGNYSDAKWKLQVDDKLNSILKKFKPNKKKKDNE